MLYSPKDYVQILDGIIPTKKKFELFKAYIRYNYHSLFVNRLIEQSEFIPPVFIPKLIYSLLSFATNLFNVNPWIIIEKMTMK